LGSPFYAEVVAEISRLRRVLAEAAGISAMKITTDTQAARKLTYDALREESLCLSWPPEFVDAALRRPGIAVSALKADASFVPECAALFRTFYPHLASQTVTSGVLWDAPHDTKQTLLRFYVARELGRFARIHRTNLSTDCREECTSILIARMVDQERGYEVAGYIGTDLVAWYYAKYHWSQIRAAWPSLKKVAFQDSVSIDELIADRQERKALENATLCVEDTEKEGRCATIQHLIGATLASDVHSEVLRRVLVGGESVSQVTEDLGYAASWFSTVALRGFRKRLMEALAEKEIAVSVRGRADARVIRGCFAQMGTVDWMKRN
jgi:hypothetical protein